METRELTCISCPLGCPLNVEIRNGEVVNITGHTCKRGEEYARKEVTNPTRIVTSTVRVTGGNAEMVSVKTKTDIPKDKIFDCIYALKGVTVNAPVRIGDLILADVAGTGVDIAATKEVLGKGGKCVEKKEFKITNMNAVTEDDDTTCGLNDMNCLEGEDDKTCGLTDMNCVEEEEDKTCGLNDMNCLGE